MIKLKQIVNEILSISEGGKLFGAEAARVSTQEMNDVFKEVSPKLTKYFKKMELSRALPSKENHGDIDIVFISQPIRQTTEMSLKGAFGQNLLKFSKNGNIHSVLYHSDSINKNVHIDFIQSTDEEDFSSIFEYLSYNDFSGIIGVLARQLGFSYSSEGFFKVFVDKKGRHHKILLTKNLRNGLKVLGYESVLPSFDEIKTNDDIISFITSSPLFDSDDYVGQTMNHSDRKRVRAGRPSADYIRNKLIESDKHRTITDPDFFLKKLFPDMYDKLREEMIRIDSIVIPKSKYNGEWLMKTFPQIKPGPVIGKVLKFWHEKYGDKLDDVEEEELTIITSDFLKTL